MEDKKAYKYLHSELIALARVLNMALRGRLGAGVGVWIALIIIIAIISAAGGYYSGLSQALPSKTLPSEIKIGVLLPLSGDLSVIGREMLKGAQLAIDQINEAGGIAGRKVVLVVGNTKSDREGAVAEAKRLIDAEGVKVIIGPATNPSTLAVASIVNERHVVLISPSSTSPEISKPENDPGNFVFRVIGSDSLQGLAMAAIAEELGFKSAVIVAMDSDYGRGLADVINRTFTVHGGQVLNVIYYNPVAGDYVHEVEQVKALNPDVIFFVGYRESASRLLKDAKTVGITSKWVATEDVCDESMFNDPEVAEYIVGMYGVKRYLPVESILHKQFVQAYIEKFGAGPGKYADYTYDATMLASLAIAYAGDYNGTAIRDALFTVSKFFMGTTGPKLFDHYGDVSQDYDVWKVVYEDGRYKF